MGPRRAGMPARPAGGSAGDLAFFAVRLLAEQAAEPGCEPWIAAELAHRAIAQFVWNSAPAQRRRDIGQRYRDYAEPALIGIIADAEIESPDAVAVQRGHGAFDDQSARRAVRPFLAGITAAQHHVA